MISICSSQNILFKKNVLLFIGRRCCRKWWWIFLWSWMTLLSQSYPTRNGYNENALLLEIENLECILLVSATNWWAKASKCILKDYLEYFGNGGITPISNFFLGIACCSSSLVCLSLRRLQESASKELNPGLTHNLIPNEVIPRGITSFLLHKYI